MIPAAIEVDRVSKHFRLYHERNQSLKVTLLRRRRARFEQFWALRDVAFEVPEGTTFGVIGENGSGKSTLLKCMAKILRPDSGRVEVKGRFSALLELGAGFHPELSGRENVYLNGALLGLSRRELQRKFDEIVDFAGLDRFIDTPVKNYSSGMYVRLGFAVAISVEPDVLLVDEVLAVGDEQFQRRCAEKFADLRADGRTIVLVSHSLGSVRSICDSAAWLEGGVLRDVGPAGTVVDEYIDEVHTESERDPHEEARWGSGEARVDTIELLDGRGMPTRRVRTGDSIVFRFHYVIDEPIKRPVFGMAVHTVEGTHVTGPNSRDGGQVPAELVGKGHVDLEVPNLLLLPGSYDVTAAITDYATLHIFDYRHRAFRFDVEPGQPRESYGGVMSLGGRWHIESLDRAR